MSNRFAAYEYLHKHAMNGPWAERVICELGYLLEISSVNALCYDEQILIQLENLKKTYQETGAITKADALKVEAALKALCREAKSYEVTCVSHAHMDVNWLWGYNETASATIDTFRTMLQLMREYPDFVFTQSQAELYRIVEEYAPHMLDEIKQRVKEGRWEVSATSWVENDKNMTGSEAMARHILYTKRYLADLLDIPEESLTIDFEPDTFGHANMMPELLNQGGIKYYYLCRGYDGHFIYNWQAPSGEAVLTYREPKWYAQAIEPELFLHVPSFCAQYEIKNYLKVYGVGDHGGGPTRRDLDRLIEMDNWPLYPTIKFGRLDSFFQKLERHKDRFPVVDHELNYIFTGCYTSQGRIKRANRIAEDRIHEAEVLDAMASVLCEDYHVSSSFETAWRRILNNQFHDTLPGSGVTETREFALGEFQKAMATININANHAMRFINQAINTSAVVIEEIPDTAFGAGVGYGSRDYLNYKFPVAENGCGNKRIYTLYNPTQYERNDLTEIAVWDWPGEINNLYAVKPDGKQVDIQVLSDGVGYWSHRLSTLLVHTRIPSFGYTTLILEDAGATNIKSPTFSYPRNDYITDEPIILENEKLVVTFDPLSMLITSMVEKQTGKELISRENPAGGFYFVTEATSTEMVTEAGREDMSAWRMGQYAAEECLNESCAVTVNGISRGVLRQRIEYSLSFHDSNLLVTVSLDKNSSMLRYDLILHWREFGSKNQGVPLLTFNMPLAEKTPTSTCMVPFGILERKSLKQDVPCNGLMSVMQDNISVSLVSDCKYGFRNDGTGMRLSLVRSPFNPDSTPDIGDHIIALGVEVGERTSQDLCKVNECFAHPICSATNTKHPGILKLDDQMMEVTGAQITGVKQAESNSGLIIRLHNIESEDSPVVIRMFSEVKEAKLVSVTEKPVCSDDISTEGDCVRLTLHANAIASVQVCV